MHRCIKVGVLVLQPHISLDLIEACFYVFRISTPNIHNIKTLAQVFVFIFFPQRPFKAMYNIGIIMKFRLLSCAITALSPLAATAETATSTNWSGFYGGVSVSKIQR